MKAISPSAIIFGPMIGIFMEGLLLWVAVRVLGSNLVGYCVGGAVAALWSLAQTIISLFLFYGSNIGALYLHAYHYAACLLGISRFGAYDLLIALAAFQSLAGATAAFAAWKMVCPARAIDTRPVQSGIHDTNGDLFGSGATQRYSPLMLAATAALLLIGTWTTSASSLLFAFIFVAAFVLVETHHYPKALRRLFRPKLWVEIAVILLLSGLALGSLQHGSPRFGGLAIGAHMVLRAALVIVGFAALSIELRNPKILAFFGRKRLSNLSSALQSAVGVLPLFMAALAQHKQGWRHPFRTLTELMALAESLQPPTRPRLRPVTTLITGQKGQGKTALAGSVARALQSRGYNVAGILALGLWKDGIRSGFDIVDIQSGESAPLARRHGASDVRAGSFAFMPDGFRLGEQALRPEKLAKAEAIMIDEVGAWELQGGGWAPALDKLAELPKKATILVVRDIFADDAAGRWGGGTTLRFPVPQSTPEQVCAALYEAPRPER